MRVFIAGVDGYLGWPLAQHLAARGHDVAGADLGLRREWVEEMGSTSATPIASMPERVAAFEQRFGRPLPYWHADLRDYDVVSRMIREFRPDAVVHLGECPSAPYSMIDGKHTVFVQMNNVVSTFNLMFAIREHVPDAHLLKLGTMGEYGTPNVDIPEGFFEIDYRGRTDRMPFPRQAGSWYDWSKVHGSNNIMFASRIWGLRATDVMQGVVFGTRIDAMGSDDVMLTRLDFDQAFGTVINRYCCQAVIGHPLTPYGKGLQRRGFLPLSDSMQCLTLALEHPPAHGEYRVFNQFQQLFGIGELAQLVQSVAQELGISAQIRHVENPRAEMEEHYYAPDHAALTRLGYTPNFDVRGELRTMLSDLRRFEGRIREKAQALMPDVRWDGSRTRSEFLSASDLAPTTATTSFSTP